MLTKEKYIKKIIDYISILTYKINLENASGYRDTNKSIEDFYAGLLNIILGWELENANKKYPNAAGIDLIDREEQVVVQVTTTKKSGKIHHTIEACKKYPEDLTGYRLIMLMAIGKQDNYNTEFNTEGYLKFDKEKDIWDHKKIIQMCESQSSTRVLKKVYDYLEEEIKLTKDEDDHQKDVSSKFLKDRSGEYKERWTRPLFLNDGENDSNQVTVLQQDLYLPPYYTVKKDEESFDQILDYLEVKGGKLVLGHPGIGKSTLITYFLSNSSGNRKMRVFRMADFSFREECRRWRNEKNDAADRLLEAIGLEKSALQNSVLLLDGLDEISFEQEERVEFLNQLAFAFNGIVKFTWIVTCRTNYIDVEKQNLEIPYITLLEWNDTQIEQYVSAYKIQTKSEKDYIDLIGNAQKNKEVLGIPLILYMVLAADISVTADSSLIDVYERIFNLEEGGIYAKIISGKKYEQNPHAQIKEKKNTIHKISQEVAFWMFEHNADQACIPQKEYERILGKYEDLDGIHGISSFLQRTTRKDRVDELHKLVQNIHHTEGTNELCFVHRTMYEYFVVDYFIRLLNEIFDTRTEKEPFGKSEEFCIKVAYFCKKGYIWNGDGNIPNLYEFLDRKLHNLFRKNLWVQDNGVLQKLYCWWEKNVHTLFHKGTIYYAYKIDSIENCKNSLEEDLNCGQNLLVLLRIVYKIYNPEQEYEKHNRMFAHTIVETEKEIALYRYLRAIANDRNRMLLQGAALSSADLRSADLHSADLRSADLSSADLRFADLSYANLSSTYLRSADLSSADLRSAYLSSADLRSACLSFADLSYAYLSSAYLSSANLHSTNLNRSYISSMYHTIRGEGNNFPIDSIGYSKFGFINVDGIEYTRKEFFEKFQPGDDKLSESENDFESEDNWEFDDIFKLEDYIEFDDDSEIF